MELRTVNGKKQYGYLKKPLKDMLDFIVDELEKMPEVATYYSIWNDLRDTLESYYKSRSGQAQSAFAAERISRNQERHYSRSGVFALSARRFFCTDFYKSDTCRRKYSIRSFSPSASSIRISFEFKRQIVSPDEASFPRHRRATQQPDGHLRGLQTP